MKKDKNKYKELRKLVKEHNLRDYEECNTKEGLDKNSTHSSEPTVGDTEKDSKKGKLYEEYGDSVMSSETLYHEGTHTSGDDRNDTGPYVPLSDALILYTASDGGTYNSDKDTGYGESQDSDN